jgi:hypothetical protein
VLNAGTYAFGSNQRNALVILKGEKEVCQHYVNLATVAIPLLRAEVRILLARAPLKYCIERHSTLLDTVQVVGCVHLRCSMRT